MTTSTSVERRRLLARRALLCVSTILAAGFAMPATAQIAAPSPVRQNVDGNGVDLFLGTMNINAPALTLGRDQGLSYGKLNRGTGWTDNLIATLNLVGTTMTVSLGGVSDTFTVASGAYKSTEANGATLVLSSGVFTYTRSDGTVIHFDQASTSDIPYYANSGRVTDIVAPDGTKLTFTYDKLPYCSRTKQLNNGPVCTTRTNGYRLNTIRNSYGYQLVFSYGPIAEYDSSNPEDRPDLDTWSTVIGVSGVNLAGPSGTLASESFSRVYDTTGGYAMRVTDMAGNTTSYRTTGGGAVVGVTRSGSTSEDVSVGYTSGRVTSVTNHTGEVDYAASDASGERTVTVTDPLKHASIYVFDIASQRMKSMTDALSRKSSWTYDASGRVTQVTRPENDYTKLTYDARGNVTERREVGKTGTGVDDIVTTATYPDTCASAITCNEPTSTTDARAGVTNYTYDSVHGGVTSVTLPAPTANATQPKTSYTYAQFQAYFNGGSGSITASGQPVYRLTDTSTCQTLTSCAGTADEIKAHVDYGAQTAGTGNNLLPLSTSSGAGDGSLTAMVANAYDAIGNIVAVDGPLPGTDDTTTYRYDAGRRLVGTISADPDGAGPLKRRAVKTGYSGNSQPTLTELGTVNGTSDNDWSAFASLQQSTASYDTDARKVQDVVTAGGNTYGVTQYGYDVAGRPICSAVRMNTASWTASPATDACTAQAAGSAGPDRITKATYDNVGELTKTTSGYGLADAADDATGTYTDNGKLKTLADAKGNLTTYEYDAFDRLLKTRYPDMSVGAGTSSTTDYEQLGYDKAGNVLSRRLRDTTTTTIGYVYDALSRLTAKNLPNGEPAVTYSYDLLSRPTGASTSTQALTFTYDALGRNLTQGGPLGTVTAQYDAGGRRTSLSWPDQFYVTYDYLTTGEMTNIRENGATNGTGVLATFGYDDLGRRTILTRGNGTSTSYTPDAVSRLDTLAQNLPSNADSVSAKFTYNPASQIASTTRSNDAYAWRGSYNRNTPYTINGLNQATAAGTATIKYDARGNTTTIGASAYAYSAENLLLTGPSSAALVYDPLARLYQTSGSAVTRFLYDGSDMIGEYNANNALQRRYVFGPGSDEPLVWYEGASTGDKRWLHADERGSVIAVTNAAGTKIATNAFDEYGVPAIGNLGRFGYTGQTWLPELGLWYYKARMYAPSLGRFMQTDPIGYGGGTNWYGYVGGDPVNATDPSGLLATDIIVNGSRNNSYYLFGLPGSITGNFAGLHSPRDGSDDDGAPPIVVTARLTKNKNKGTLAPRAEPQNDILNHDIGADIVVVANKVPKPVQNFISNYVINYDCAFISRASCSASDYVSAGLLLTGVGVAENTAIEGASKGFAKYGIGRAGQVRFFENRLIVRLDVNKPITHLNVEGNLFGVRFNFHLPKW